MNTNQILAKIIKIGSWIVEKEERRRRITLKKTVTAVVVIESINC